MPYWDPATDVATYQGFPYAWLISSSGLDDDRVNLITTASWQNKANQDWLHLFEPGDVQIFPGLTGSGFQAQPRCITAGFGITGGADLVDRWWGTAEIGKFAVIAGDYGTNWGELKFCNSLGTEVFFDRPVGDGVNYALPVGVTATLLTAPRVAYPAIYVDEGSGPFPVLFPLDGP